MAPGRVLSGGLWRVHRLPPHGYVDECSTHGTGTSSRYIRYGLVGAGAAPGGGIATSAGAARENRPSDVPPNVRGASTSYPRELSLSRAIQARNPYRPALDLAPVRCWGSRIGEKARVGARRRCIVGPTRPFPSAAAQPLTLCSRPRCPHIGRAAGGLRIAVVGKDSHRSARCGTALIPARIRHRRHRCIGSDTEMSASDSSRVRHHPSSLVGVASRVALLRSLDPLAVEER